MVDISQLRALRAVSETGSITAAAQQTGMSQPGLSRLIERVESEIGAQLFERGRGGAIATADGEKVLDFALKTITAYDALTASMGVLSRAVGRVKIVSSTTPGEYLIPCIVAEFSAIHSDVGVESLIADSASVRDKVLARDCDAGFSGFLPSCNLLKSVPVAHDEIVLAVSVSHEFAETSEIDPTELFSQQLLYRECGSGTYATVALALREHGFSLPGEPASVTHGSSQALLSAVSSDIGVGFVSARALDAYHPSKVRAVRLKGIPLKRELYFIYEIAKQRSRQAQAFIDFVERKAALFAEDL